MNELSLFIGPKKTGTSWLHHVVMGDSEEKEIRYPARIGRSYVFNKFVSGKSLLVWPYLLHDRASLVALLEDLEARGQKFSLYVSLRDVDEWSKSMKKFTIKYGASDSDSELEVSKQADVVKENLAYLESRFNVIKVQIIDPSESDIEVMANATGVSTDTLILSKNKRIYESLETSRIPSGFFVEIFFKLKPFLPAGLQKITRNPVLRKVFFKK